MREKLYKNLLAIALIMLIMAPALALAATTPPATGDEDTLLWGGQQDIVKGELNLGEKDPRAVVAGVVNVALGFLGIVAVVIILLGGFKWMTAGGNDDKVAESKKLIFAGVIGLIIILAAWGIAKFVIGALYNATGAGT